MDKQNESVSIPAENNAVVPAENAVPAAPKRRGRPPKKKVEANTPAADNSSTPAPEAAPAPAPAAPAEPTTVTSIKDAIAIGEKVAHGAATEEKYIVTGVITEIKNETYGNLYIKDSEGNTLYIYGLYDATGARFDAMANKPAVGDTITVISIISNYNGPQLKNAVIKELVKG